MKPNEAYHMIAPLFSCRWETYGVGPQTSGLDAPLPPDARTSWSFECSDERYNEPPARSLGWFSNSPALNARRDQLSLSLSLESGEQIATQWIGIYDWDPGESAGAKVYQSVTGQDLKARLDSPEQLESLFTPTLRRHPDDFFRYAGHHGWYYSGGEGWGTAYKQRERVEENTAVEYLVLLPDRGAPGRTIVIHQTWGIEREIWSGQVETKDDFDRMMATVNEYVQAEAEHTGLLVRVTPWADVSVDGKPIGRTPLVPIMLPPGSHTVLMLHPDYLPYSREVSIRSGEFSNLELNLRREAVPKRG